MGYSETIIIYRFYTRLTCVHNVWPAQPTPSTAPHPAQRPSTTHHLRVGRRVYSPEFDDGASLRWQSDRSLGTHACCYIPSVVLQWKVTAAWSSYKEAAHILLILIRATLLHINLCRCSYPVYKFDDFADRYMDGHDRRKS